MDIPHQQQKTKFCIKHNQPIIFFDQEINQDLCVLCVQEKTGMVSIEKIQQEQQEIKLQSDKEFLLELEQLQQILNSILRYKQDLINGIDKIIQIIFDQIQINKQIQEQFTKQLEQRNEFIKFNYLKSQLQQQEDNHEQIKKTIKQLLSDFQQKYINVDCLSEVLKKSPQTTEKQLYHNTGNKIKIQEIMQNSGVLQYEFIEESRTKEFNYCYSFAFNNDNSILIIGCSSQIKIYQFINGKIGRQLQLLSSHKTDFNSLYFMKKSNCFVSGSSNKLIIIWKYERNDKWVTQQILTDHQKDVNCLLMNKNEDLLISGSQDKTVKFWKKEDDQWICQQTIKTDDWVYAINLSEMENKLIACGLSNIQVMEVQVNKQWIIKQKIDVDQCGNRLCFTFGNQFILQPITKDYLEVYDYDSSLNLFKKQSQVQIQSCEQCDTLFPCQFIKSLSLLLVKHGKYLNIFQVNKNKNFQLIQTIQFNHHWLYGTVSDDGQYLVTWDDGSQEIQVRKLKQINQ